VSVEATAEAPPSEAAIETVEQEDVEPSVEAVAAPPSAEGPEARGGEAGVWVMPEGETESAETVDQDLDDQPGPSIAPLPDVEPAPLIKPEPDSSTEPLSVATPELGSALVTEPEPAVVEEPAVAGPTIIDEETVTVAGPQPGTAEPTEEASVERSSVDRAVTEAFDLDREEPAPAAGEAAAPVDQAAMRRRIEETRNRLKAKAFDAMAGGEAALLSKEQEPSPSQQAVAPGAEEGLDDDVKAVIDRSLSQDDY
jgi:hypothetical protein